MDISLIRNWGSTVGRPVVFNTPIAGTSAIEPVGTTVNTDPGQEVSGIMFVPDGTLCGLFTTGDYATINLSSGALEDMASSNIPTASGNLRGDLAHAFFVDDPLPVTLGRFDATLVDDMVQLKWLTYKEQSLAYFVIERCADGKQWASVKTVKSRAANGNSNEQLEYCVIDNAPLPGNNYYRLKHVSMDGIYGYSTARVVNVQIVTLYPNPVVDQLHISSSGEIALAIIYNSDGKEIVRSTRISIATDNMTQGAYMLFVRFKDGTTTSTRPFIKR